MSPLHIEKGGLGISAGVFANDDDNDADDNAEMTFEHPGSGLPRKVTSTRRMAGRLTSIHRRSSSSFSSSSLSPFSSFSS